MENKPFLSPATSFNNQLMRVCAHQTTVSVNEAQNAGIFKGS